MSMGQLAAGRSPEDRVTSDVAREINTDKRLQPGLRRGSFGFGKHSVGRIEDGHLKPEPSQSQRHFAGAATHVQRPTLRLRRQKLTQVLPGEVRPQPTSHGSQVIGVRGGIDCGRVSACH